MVEALIAQAKLNSPVVVSRAQVKHKDLVAFGRTKVVANQIRVRIERTDILGSS